MKRLFSFRIYRMICLNLLIVFPGGIISSQTGTREQDPKEPFPYVSREVTFRNTLDSVTLAGTLTLPEGKGPFPAVVLISGSGLQNRNEELMNHRPFLVLSDYLTRNGIAVLRYDDRGVGGSERSKTIPTTENFARDAEAALAFLRTQKEIHKKKTGLIGHSEGGTIAFIIASRNRAAHFIVSLAGSAVRGDSLLLSQQRAAFALTTYNKEFVDNQTFNNREVFAAVIASTANDSLLKKQVDTILLKYRPFLNEKQLRDLSRQFLGDYMYYCIRYDPQPDIKKVKIPVLALNGTKDCQVVSAVHLPAMEHCLKEAGNKQYKIVELEGLNHLFQECGTGDVMEYFKIEQTISPKVLEIVTAWIKEL